MYYYNDILAKENDNCQENFTTFQNREIFIELDESEVIFNDEKQNSLNFINNKDNNSEIIMNDEYMITENCMIHQNYYNANQKEIKLTKENELILKTEKSEKTSHTNRQNNKENKHNLIHKAKK